MKSRYGNAWIGFLEEVEQAKLDLQFGKNEECFFRGHIQTDHQLLPGLFRGIAKDKSVIPGSIWDAEYSTFYEFRARAKEVHQGNLSDWDVLFYMQHHGCKTRLLDWTENFGVALYFSMLGVGSANFSPTIWLLNPYRLNELYHDSRDLYSPEFLDNQDGKNETTTYSDVMREDQWFWWDKPIALYPIRRVDRLTTQGGYFTVHGNDIRPLELIVPAKKKLWRKIVIPDNVLEMRKTS